MSRYATLVMFLSIIAINFGVLSVRRYFTRKKGVRVPQGKVSRLRDRLKNPEWRRYGLVLLGGKMAGLALVIAAAFYFNPGLFGHKVFAADAVLKGNDIVNPVNTAWTLIAAFLVFGMQVGFTMLEAGFCRSRETVNVLMECVVDTCLCGLLFYAWGFSFMFSHGNGFIGYHWFFLQNAPATYESTGVAFLAFWIFQFAFADTCSTITSGAMIGRTAFAGDLLYSVAVSGFIYPIIGHWAWGPDGFLATMGSAGTVNGFLAGLVAITCPCYWVSPTGAILLGGIAGVIVVGGVELLEWLRIDDPIGALPVHGICGTLSLGLFAVGRYGATGPIAPDNSAPLRGLFYGGGLTLFKAQFIGSATITLATFAVSMLVMYLVHMAGLLRVSKEGELYGLDLHEHGISAYPEYVITALGTPSGGRVGAGE
jgi:ammonia channel protein AmtB